MSSTIRCLRVLDVLAEAPFEFSLTDITARLRLVKGSAHRMVRTLCDAGLVEQDPRSKLYRLSPKSFWIGTAYLRNSDVYSHALPLMHSLAEQTRAAANLAAWHAGSLLYLHTVNPPGLAPAFAQIGERWPVHGTGLGKAMLAFRPESELDEMFEVDRPRYTPSTIVTKAAMQTELVRIREQGYALDDEEVVQGMRCVAAPIFLPGGEAAAAMSLSGPAGEMAGERLDECVRALRGAALRVSMQLGYRPAAGGPIV